MNDEKIPYTVAAMKSFFELEFIDISKHFEYTDFNGRMEVTEESLRVGDTLAHMLRLNKTMEMLEYHPHVVSNNIAAADLRTAKHLREKLVDGGRKFYLERGSVTEFASYIDKAINHIIQKREGLNNFHSEIYGTNEFTTVKESMKVKLSIFPKEVYGTPDAMWKDYPVEIKTVPDIRNFANDRRRQSSSLNQLALYQIASKNVKGFLVVICRETGHSACFEATGHNISVAKKKWRNWMSPFSQTCEAILKDISTDSNTISARTLLSTMMFKQLNGVPRKEEEIQAFEKLANLISLLNSKSRSELTEDEIQELIDEHDEWLSHMFEMAVE